MTVLGRCALALAPLTVALGQYGGGYGGGYGGNYGYYGGGGYGGQQDTRQGVKQAVAQSGGSPCQPNSVPAFDCDFTAEPGAKLSGGKKPCLAGLNTGQNARPNSLCEVPSPRNRCELHFDPQAKAWMFYSEYQGVECCNCFQENQVCPMGSLPFYDCDFSGRPGPNACLPAVNTAQLAKKNKHCEAPSPENECLIKYNSKYKAFMFESRKRHVTCCNCFQLASMFPEQQQQQHYGGHGRYLLEVNATEHKQEATAEAAEPAAKAEPEAPKRKATIRSHLRPSAASHGDAASMLQLPMGADSEIEEAEAELPADLQEEGAEL